MKLRFRIFGALVMLLALTVYFAEGVWASVCPPGMAMTGTEEVMELDAPEQPCPMEMNSTSSDTSESPEHSHSEAPGCPLGPLGTTGSCVAASLPAPTIQMTPSLPEDVMLSRSPDAARDLLLAAALFHPPKA